MTANTADNILLISLTVMSLWLGYFYGQEDSEDDCWNLKPPFKIFP